MIITIQINLTTTMCKWGEGGILLLAAGGFIQWSPKMPVIAIGLAKLGGGVINGLRVIVFYCLSLFDSLFSTI